MLDFRIGSPFLTTLVKMDELPIKDSPEDVTWLCSLSESEIDMLCSLKLLILRRAKMIGHKELAEKFDLKMLRAIALVLMEYLKAQVKDSSLIPDVVKSADFLDSCNLLKCVNEGVMSIEDLSEKIGVNLEKLARRQQTGVGFKSKKQKFEKRTED
ncbi:uncharacterized protein G2W53_016759 [Senna tora]|uniref:Uncharacterized protein n=1 Tax=Senna tora TaxID=362788 RepID=A0A834TSC3_9FABA|nr:uncharacterized protein G2W53_016759 [Senna tora]